MWDFGYDEINMSCYGVTGIMEYDSKLKSYVLADDITMDDLGKVTYDTLTITHKSLR